MTRKSFRVRVPKRTPNRKALRRATEAILNAQRNAEILKHAIDHFTLRKMLTGEDATTQEIDAYLEAHQP